MSGRWSRTELWLPEAIIDANQPSCLVVHQMMLWKSKGMAGRKACLWTASPCDKGEVSYVGRSENISRWLSWEAKGKVCTMWWLSQEIGLRGACGCLVCCPVLNSCHITTDFIAFAIRDVFNSHFNSYGTVWLYSVLNFISALLKNWHLQHEIVLFQGSQALFQMQILHSTDHPTLHFNLFFPCLLHGSLGCPDPRAACAAELFCNGHVREYMRRHWWMPCC